MPNVTSQTIAADSGPWSQLRTGTVTSQDATFVNALVGGVQVRAAYLKTAVFTAGEIVALVRQDATWLALGAISGQGPNLVQNPSFEDSVSGIPPNLWFRADITGVNEVTVVTSTDAPDGDQYAVVFSDSATSQAYLYSSPIAVTAGDIFNLSAYVTGIYVIDAPQTADAALVALWFADADDLYPTTSSADIIVDTFTDVPSGPPFVQLSGSVTAPVSGFMRVALRSTMAVTQSMGWDFVIARRVG